MGILQEFNHHSILGLTGPNGCGKSTLLKKLKLETDNDSIYMNQFPLEANRFILLDDVLKSFISKPGEVESQLEYFDLKNKLQTDFNVLSGGEKQIVKILISVNLSKNYIFLDEPTSFLDSEKKEKLLSFIQKYSEKRKWLIVDHDKEFLENLSEKVIDFNEVRND